MARIGGGDLPPVHPGEILREEFMVPLGINISQLAKDLHVAPNRISQILHGSRALTAGTALRLSAFFGTTAQFWVNLQALYDLEVATAKESATIRRQVRHMPPTARFAQGQSLCNA